CYRDWSSDVCSSDLNILAGLGAQFPGLKLPLENQDLQFSFHIERKPEGGFLIHSSDPNAEPIAVLTHNDMESHFAEKIIGFIGKIGRASCRERASKT